MSSFDQSAGCGRDGVKKRYSMEIWLPSTIRVGSARLGVVLRLYPLVRKTVGRSVSLWRTEIRCWNVPFHGRAWSIGCS